MKIISREVKVNEETFAPEMILTISLPMQLAQLVQEGDLEVTKYELVYKELKKALEEYNRGVK